MIFTEAEAAVNIIYNVSWNIDPYINRNESQ